jgi:hypothetical protein
MIFLKQGMVQVSKLEKKIKELAPLETTVTCKSQMNMFNMEIEQQWKQNQHQISEKEFVNTINFFHDFWKPELKGKTGEATSKNYDNDDRDWSQENEDKTEGNLKEIYHLTTNHPTRHSKRKNIRICWHKLQQRTGCNHKSKTKQLKPRGQLWLSGQEEDIQAKLETLEPNYDPEWDQLREMEEFLRLQREELLQRGARDQDHSGLNPCHQWQLEDDKSFLEDQEEDDPEEAYLAFITSILESYSQHKTLTLTRATKTEHNLED